MLARVLDLHHEVPQALHNFMQIRSPQLQRYFRASRWLTAVLQSESQALAFVRDQLFGKVMAFSLARRMAREIMS